MGKKLIKWGPARSQRRPDNIISSKAVSNGERGFRASYEQEERPNIRFLITDEYRRKWFNEREKHEYDIKLLQNEVDKSIKRRIISRNLNYKGFEKKSLPIIKPREFKHLFYTKTQPKEKVTRYKINCGKTTNLKGEKNEQKKAELIGAYEKFAEFKSANKRKEKGQEQIAKDDAGERSFEESRGRRNAIKNNGIQDYETILIPKIGYCKTLPNEVYTANGTMERSANEKLCRNCGCCLIKKNGIQDEETSKLCDCKFRMMR